MALNSIELLAKVAREKDIIATSKSVMTRNYARERLSYWRGELMLQKAHEARGGCRHEWSVRSRVNGHETWGCELCGVTN